MTVPHIEQRLQRLLQRPGNDTCSECDRSDNKPTWASFFVCPVDNRKLGVFCCPNCHYLHQSVGEGEFRLKGLRDTDEFTEDDLRALEISGNSLVNTAFERLVRDEKDDRDIRKYGYEAYFFEKFVNRRFFDEGTYKELIAQSLEANAEKQPRRSSSDKRLDSGRRSSSDKKLDSSRRSSSDTRLNEGEEKRHRDDNRSQSKGDLGSCFIRKEYRKSSMSHRDRDTRSRCDDQSVGMDSRMSRREQREKDEKKSRSGRDSNDKPRSRSNTSRIKDKYSERSSHRRSRSSSRPDDGGDTSSHHRSNSRLRRSSTDRNRRSRNSSSSGSRADKDQRSRDEDRHGSRNSLGYESSHHHRSRSTSRLEDGQSSSHHRSSDRNRSDRQVSSNSRPDKDQASSRDMRDRPSSRNSLGHGSSHHRSKSRSKSNDRDGEEERTLASRHGHFKKISGRCNDDVSDGDLRLQRDTRKGSKNDLCDESGRGGDLSHSIKRGSNQDLLDVSDVDEDRGRSSSNNDLTGYHNRANKRREMRKDGLKRGVSPKRTASSGKVSSLGVEKPPSRNNSSSEVKRSSSSSLKKSKSGGSLAENQGEGNATWDLADLRGGVQRAASYRPVKREVSGRSPVHDSKDSRARGVARSISAAGAMLRPPEVSEGGTSLRQCSTPPASANPDAASAPKKISAREFLQSRKAQLLEIAKQEKLEREATGNPVVEEEMNPMDFLRSHRKQIIQMAKRERSARGAPIQKGLVRSTSCISAQTCGSSCAPSSVARTAPSQRGLRGSASSSCVQSHGPPCQAAGEHVSARDFLRSRRSQLLEIARQERLEREAAGNPVAEEPLNPLDFLRSQRKQIVQMARKERAARATAASPMRGRNMAERQRAQLAYASQPAAAYAMHALQAEQAQVAAGHVHGQGVQYANSQCGPPQAPYAQHMGYAQSFHRVPAPSQMGYGAQVPNTNMARPGYVVQDFNGVPSPAQIAYCEQMTGIPTGQDLGYGQQHGAPAGARNEVCASGENRGANYWRQRLQTHDSNDDMSPHANQESGRSSMSNTTSVPTACA
ncbi:expressed unknown protein [Seminavis robusta]|uniref:Arf-GAP domain-containing protein n=1 Tax=Seminavis robusta TaxID=568900 RepID=A0A9N8ED87_9STRA|nr:expressed unknown protein [Seminavis robusta]|eukprot:Sro825_g207670.1 n/a (1053) ;mRNA; r:17719-20966